MGTGYVRNDTGNNISDNNVIDASDLDGEFDAIVAAFNETTGHTHDGTSAEGGPITVVGPAQNVSISGTVVEPSVDDTVSLGSASKEFKDLYIDGTANIDSLVADTVDINAGTIDNTVIGGTTPAAATVTTMTTTGAGVVGTTLGVTGATTLGSTLDTTGATTLSSTLDVTGATTLGSTLDVTGVTTVDDLTATGTTTLAAVDINGGAIDGTTIGANSAAAGTFTNLTSTGTSTHTTVDINGGAIDGVTIGAAAAGAGTFTTLTGTTTIIGTNGGGTPADATLVAQSNNPTLLFVDNNGTSKATRIRPDNAFNIDKVDDTTYTLTSNMYSIPYDASGATSHKWRVGANDKMALTSTGLGIGTTSPSAALDVVGDSELNGSLTVTGTSTLATVDINAGAIDGTIVGASSAAAGTFTNLTSTGTSTHATVDINGGAIDGTVIGGSSAAAGSFTTLNVSGDAAFDTDTLFVDVSTNRVGIGTTSPNAALDVADGRMTFNGNRTGGDLIVVTDDAVGTITPPKTGGFAFLSTNATLSTASKVHSGMFYYNVGSSLSIEVTNGFSNPGGVASQLDTSTSAVTGTTGVDTNVTVAVQSGQLQFENRTGATVSFHVTWM